MPLSSRAVVATDRPVPYMKQLCKHFRHKHEVSWTESQGTLKFPFGTGHLRSREDTLELVVHAADEARLEYIERVVGGHLERFGRRDELTVEWTRTDSRSDPDGSRRQ